MGTVAASIKLENYMRWWISKGLLTTCFIIGLLLTVFPSSVLAGIEFKEVTREAGINHAGASYGSSWGDFNGDGWPDVWVGNHNTKPSLYLNRQDGTFEDIIDQVWSGDVKADTHGAAWADFDSDGDQDLVEVAAAAENPDGTYCAGCGENNLFRNEGGRLVECGADAGLNLRGQASTPLWFDANRDGLLDLLVANTRGAKQPSSYIFLQDENHHFQLDGETIGFKDAPWERMERIMGRVKNLMILENRSVPFFAMHNYLEFAELADLTGTGHPGLVFFSLPTRIYDISSNPFKDMTATSGLPNLSRIKDVSIADFNGDGKMDMALAEGLWLPSHYMQVNPSQIKAMITWSGGLAPKEIRFKADGDVHFEIYPTWLPLSNIFIGADGRHPENREFILSPDDPGVTGALYDRAPGFEGVVISYDRYSGIWTIRNAQRSTFVDLIAKSDGLISGIESVNFNPYEIEGKGLLFLRKGNGFVKHILSGESGEETACISLAAGDFDNDMDMDLYLVCTGPIMNLPNQLLENDGKGRFHVVPNAGGASGSDLGRGDTIAIADFDRDGFLDLFVTNGADPNSPFVADGPHQLFRNQGNNNHWLEIDLEGTVSNRDGIGARVTLDAGGITQIRDQGGGMHRITQNHQRIHFGLGGFAAADRITVVWPSGIVQQLDNVQADRILKITEPLEDKK